MTLPKILAIGTCQLGVVPRSTAIIEEPLPYHVVRNLKDIGVDLLEIRVDCFEENIQAVCDYIARLRKICSLPLIGTIRENERTKENRVGMFSKVIPLVDAIDIEIDATVAPKVISMAEGKTIIISEHNFEITPTTTDLNRIVERAELLGGHIVKIAAMAHGPQDVVRLLQFIGDCAMPIVAFSMGEYGAISRIVSMLFGSLYSYGYVTKPNAPGQLHIEKLIEEMRLYYPQLR
jgi:3-dehydroquinate dehydratase-1